MTRRSRILTDRAALQALVDAGATTADIAAQAGTGERAVRYALRRHGVNRPTPPAVDLGPLRRDYAAGVPVEEIAAAYGRSTTWVRDKAAKAKVHRPPPSEIAHPELPSADALRRLLDETGSIRAAADRLSVTRPVVRNALQRHAVTVVPHRYLEGWRLAVEAEEAGRSGSAKSSPNDVLVG